MGFASGLLQSLEVRGSQVESEFTRGDRLEEVLERHLLAVEQNFDGELVTSILLLSQDGRRLFHAAGPKLPRSYRDAIDGSKIGPCAGSCGTAAYLRQPVYVTDIANDPLWEQYRHLALAHGFRSCWSTPIQDRSGTLIGTFATYHRTPGSPTREEIDAISIITEHVAQAILLAWGVDDDDQREATPNLQVVADDFASDAFQDVNASLLQSMEKLETLALELDRQAETAGEEKLVTLLSAAAADIRRLVSIVRHKSQHVGSA